MGFLHLSGKKPVALINARDSWDRTRRCLPHIGDADSRKHSTIVS